MKIKRRSELTQQESEREIDVTEEQLARYEDGGILLQDAFPHLDADDREFIKTGITPEEWSLISPPEDE